MFEYNLSPREVKSRWSFYKKLMPKVCLPELWIFFPNWRGKTKGKPVCPYPKTIRKNGKLRPKKEKKWKIFLENCRVTVTKVRLVLLLFHSWRSRRVHFFTFKFQLYTSSIYHKFKRILLLNFVSLISACLIFFLNPDEELYGVVVRSSKRATNDECAGHRFK